jgi:hypothetical protein
MNTFRSHLTVFYIVMMIGASSTALANFLVVTPEQVSVTQEGLFVSIHNIPIAVESLNVANNGCIVAVPIPSLYADICPSCGHDSYTSGRTCSYCGFPLWDRDSGGIRKR